MEICLSEVGHDVVTAKSVSDALLSLDASAFDVASLDLRMDGEALEVADWVWQNDIPFVFCTGGEPPDQRKFRDVPLVLKPFSEMDLIAAIESAAGVRGGP